MRAGRHVIPAGRFGDDRKAHHERAFHTAEPGAGALTGTRPAAEIRSHAAILPLNPFQAQWLDLLRGLAAQMVVLAHAIELVGLQHAGGAEFAQFGLSVFFLLSGFLITQTILDRAAGGRFTLREFMVSRFARIFTPLLPALVLIALVDALVRDAPNYLWREDFTFATAIANLAMLQDFPIFQVLRRLGVAEQPWFFGPFGSGRPLWTISIEWWIYVAVGLFAAHALGRRLPRWAGLVLAFALIEPAYHAIGNGLTLFWILGGLLAIARRSPAVVRMLPAKGKSSAMLWLAALTFAALAAARLFFKQWLVFDPTFMTLAALMLFTPVFGAERGRGVPSRLLRPFAALAFHSYSLYLIHFTLLVALLPLLGEAVGGWPLIAAAILCANAAALPFAMAFEVRHRAVRAWLLARTGRVR